MSWKCIKCENSNSDSQKICRICDLERFYTQSELDAKLDKETPKFQSPVRSEQNGRWKVVAFSFVALTLIPIIICIHLKFELDRHQRLSNEKSVQIDRLKKEKNAYIEEYMRYKMLLESVSFVGPKDWQGSGGYAYISDVGLYFDVFEKCILDSIDMYPKREGYLTVELLDKNSKIVNSTKVSLIGGKRNKVSLGFMLNVGNDYLLKARGVEEVSLYRNTNSETRYPFELRDIIKIKSSTFGKSYYYYFYNWKILIPFQ